MNILTKRVTSGNEFDEEYDDFRQSFLNKKAKKQEDLSFDSKLEENRKNDKYTESIESLLESHEDWGHQFSDDDLKTLLNGLKLVGDYLDKTILKPNNLNYPNSRLLFINSFK